MSFCLGIKITTFHFFFPDSLDIKLRILKLRDIKKPEVVEWEIVTFSVNHGGYWVKNLAGHVSYISGEVKTLEGKPEDLYE
ncbi:unnamed protein product [Eruca vesicaria subsp. sativa]|uniref:Uncharacterized protein n=1 Tax=Eruca vesicaria subsp. sativa TaxID=29727 RepID=A0ABC8KED5_ERUVS|nr:unnamed protein product [Eruca vesicaria subsp. sativa]